MMALGFLLLVFLSFIFDTEREHYWLEPLERLLARIGKADAVARGGAVKFGILASGNAGHAFSSLGALASSGPMI